MTLTEFLLARIGEDVALAERSVQIGRKGTALIAFGKPDAAPVLIVHPERVIAECEAKRAMVLEYDFLSKPVLLRDRLLFPTMRATLLPLLQMHAAIYAHHADYQPDLT